MSKLNQVKASQSYEEFRRDAFHHGRLVFDFFVRVMNRIMLRFRL